MVVIDCEKHVLDYKSSARDNGIPALKEKYQGGARRGASTLISRASQETRIDKRRARRAPEGGAIDPLTGKKVFVPTGESYVDRKTGKTAILKEKHARLAVTENAHDLVSGTPTRIENLYADHSNRLKNMANEARLDSLHTGKMVTSPSAKKVYAHEVASLDAKLNVAQKNAPLERHAQSLANSWVAQKKAANPDLEPEDIKKISNQALAEARVRTGAGKTRVDVTPSEWTAIQAGAVSTKKLNDILDNGNLDTIRRLATPRDRVGMTSASLARAQQMIDDGYTQADIADALGVKLSTLKVGLYGDVSKGKTHG